jgi:cobyrinic acid a,c-diamide synthase
VNVSPCARLVIAGVSSGVGKTTFTAGLCRALRRRGLQVAVFKCGPDYLDPSYHRRASGRVVHNLDGWLMGEQAVRDSFARNAYDTDVSLIEGVMGLFDGAEPESLTGSTAEIARWLDAPIALLCDARGMARSIAALAHGFASFDPTLPVRGLICNRLGSAGHLALLQRVRSPLPLLGGLVRDPQHAFPERHLGLHSADEIDPEASFEAFADQIEQHCDLDALLALARSAPPLPLPAASPVSAVPRCRIGVARDEAFHFYYDANLRLLEAAGAELVPFSPLRDRDPGDVHGVYIGGGYPELHAAQLAANGSMRAALLGLGQRGAPIYAECGGLMYLSEAIVTRDGGSHVMLGLVPGRAIMTDRLQALGYVEVETRSPSPLGPAGTRFRGHQFRHSRFESTLQAERYVLRTVRGAEELAEGYGRQNVLGSYVHAHWASNPAIAAAFVAACARASRAGTCLA